jgi:transcriptional activator of cad operon
MERLPTTGLRIGAWSVHPAAGEISRDGETVRLEVRTMRLLMCLAERPGDVVSIDDLLNQVWSDVTVTPDSVYQAVASLRRALGDDPKQPAYIATVPRLGYRLLATVGPADAPAREPSGPPPIDAPAPRPRARAIAMWSAAALCVALAGVFVFRARATNGGAPPAPAPAPQAQKSIAVLPFLDLTEGMKEEEFADGMTEELIDKLSKIPGLRVPAPTASFYFKNKRVPVAEIGRRLGVAYVLDGSVRKSGGRLRVAARLVRPDDGYVIWSESYDRPWADVIVVQDEIAAEVAKALKSHGIA